MKKAETLRTEFDKEVAVVIFDRPASFNAMNSEFFEEFLSVLRKLRHSNDTRCVLFTGEGKAFSAGGDVGFMSRFENPEKEFQMLADQLNSIMLELYNFPVPTVAAINGPAVGAGLSVALACDYRIMSDDAFLMFGYSGIGLTPDGGLSWILPRIVGSGRFMQVVVDNPKISAEKALEWGMVQVVVPGHRLKDTGLEKAGTMAKLPVQAVVNARRLMIEGWSRSIAEQLDRERWAIARAAAGEGKEGIRAFVEKREPDYRKRDK